MGSIDNAGAEIYDMVIIGGGPAGLAAGMYAARGRMNVLMLESLSVMGQATMTDAIENYPGIETSTGYGLVLKFKEQAEKFGLRSEYATVSALAPLKENGLDVWAVAADSGSYKALSVIVASGASARKLGIPGEKEFTGKGVSYCATCDAPFFRDKELVVIGGGDTAVEEALYLAKFGKKVTLVHRKDRLRASRILQERAMAADRIGFVWNSVVESIEGAEKVERAVLKDVRTGEVSGLACDGVFIFAGWIPNTDFVKGVVELDGRGCVKVDPAMRTSAGGVFAAGDCCSKVFHQVVTAAGDGATAAFCAQKYVEELKGEAYE